MLSINLSDYFKTTIEHLAIIILFFVGIIFRYFIYNFEKRCLYWRRFLEGRDFGRLNYFFHTTVRNDILKRKNIEYLYRNLWAFEFFNYWTPKIKLTAFLYYLEMFTNLNCLIGITNSDNLIIFIFRNSMVHLKDK